ncbi:ATP-binding protein [Actinosynnema sp. NPDC059335]|uniref:ATP-binding protein n=1 Tax=Actinosynnema sp. NPDC059335 TaxID=3346804 RepID=UPI003672C308
MDVVRPPVDPVDFDLECGATSVRRARRWITGNVLDLDQAKRLDLLLIADALVTNAFEHAGSPRRLRLSRRGDLRVVRVEVLDASPELLPVLGRPGSLRHRGLRLVNRLASRWGVDPRPEYKSVWGEVVA